jgi:hypothetical protein
MLHIYPVVLETLAALRGLLAQIERHDSAAVVARLNRVIGTLVKLVGSS